MFGFDPIHNLAVYEVDFIQTFLISKANLGFLNYLL